MREREVMHVTWKDVHLAQRVIEMSAKPEFGFVPKTHEERAIPVPASLIASVRELKEKREKNCDLVFATRGCRPKLDFLDVCKAVAARAGMDPADWWLHKFRATFATRALRTGTDLRTCQHWMGHKDLASTSRYLRPAEGSTAQQNVDAMWA